MVIAVKCDSQAYNPNSSLREWKETVMIWMIREMQWPGSVANGLVLPESYLYCLKGSQEVTVVQGKVGVLTRMP